MTGPIKAFVVDPQDKDAFTRGAPPNGTDHSPGSSRSGRGREGPAHDREGGGSSWTEIVVVGKANRTALFADSNSQVPCYRWHIVEYVVADIANPTLEPPFLFLCTSLWCLETQVLKPPSRLDPQIPELYEPSPHQMIARFLPYLLRVSSFHHSIIQNA